MVGLAFTVFSLLGSLFLLLGLEGLLALALRSPPGFGPVAFETARLRYYMDHERSIVQYRPECAEYDAELGYRLKPGSCRFANREFDTELRINSLGTRDDESALLAPRIVVLGDSFAMGWGVEQEETVSAQLARLSGERTLNVAVSSWGTAREMLALRRVDLSAIHTLVIQYSENDFIENRKFELRGGRLPVMTQAEYDGLVRDHLNATRYTPGKHLRHLVPLLWQGLRSAPAPPSPRDCGLDAAAFVGALRLAPPLPHPVRVIVYEGLYRLDQPACFVDEVEARRGRLPGWIGSLETVDASLVLSEEDYWDLDDHLRPSGQRKVAEAVARVLARSPEAGGDRARGSSPRSRVDTLSP